MLFPVHLLVLKCTLQDLWLIILFNVYIAGILGGVLVFLFGRGVFLKVACLECRNKKLHERRTPIYIYMYACILQKPELIFFSKRTLNMFGCMSS